jgi:NitT/TauT family transport system substrate-binding protein
MSKSNKFTTGMIALAAVFAAGILQLNAAEKIHFVLNWVPGGDHAPVYWAKEQGWYADAGIDLVIENGTGSGASAKKVGIGRNQVGIADLPTALRAIGKGADIVAVMNIYANSPYGIYWKKSSGIKTFSDLKGRTIGNPPFDAARQMWPAIAKVLKIDPDSVKFVNVKPNAKVAAMYSGAIDATTNFYNVHYIYQRIFKDDMGFVALRDLGYNPYGNSIIANGAWAKANADTLKNFVSVTQRAYAACVTQPKPCIETLAKAGSKKVSDVTENWKLVVELMTHETSVKNAIGYFDPGRMQTDYDGVRASFKDIADFDIKAAYSNAFLDMAVKMPKSGL